MVPYCSCCLCLYFGSSIMLVTYFVGFGWLGGRLFGGGGLFVLFAAGAFRGLSSVCVFGCFPFGFAGGIWDLVVSVPDHCLSFYFTYPGCLFHHQIPYNGIFSSRQISAVLSKKHDDYFRGF